ncbi:hypothetical protein BJX99DRAFT_260841 [Aspergillus californicus]
MSAMLSRTLLRAPRSTSVLRVPSSTSNVGTARHSFLTYGRSRTFTSSASRLLVDQQGSSQSTSSSLKAENEVETQLPSEPAQHIPWYLQEDSAIPEAKETFSQEQLPELPENPPKILPDLLEYVFKDLGLDGLKLFDLRTLDTPPALGANVIMIMGTARSVKHLNVSADRLCRWLRSNWKLAPYADGLLGRNELKIKLRRKARRARIASRTGAMSDDRDDGITTGWICVNAGVVEKGPVQERPEGAFEGFGHLGGGTRVVVQVFTEEKRAELDLDGLWERKLARAERDQHNTPQPSVDADAPEKVRSPNSIIPSQSDYKFSNALRSPPTVPLEQKRLFHSTRYYRDSDVGHNVADAPSVREPDGATVSNQKENSKSSSAPLMLRYLETLDKKQLEIVLGDNPLDSNSTEFLRLYHMGLSELPIDKSAFAELELICLAISRGVYVRKESVHRTYMNCCVSACDIPDHMSITIAKFMLTPRTTESIEWLPDSDKELAADIFDQLVLRGFEGLLSLELYSLLYSAASLPSSPDAGENDASPVDKTYHIRRIIEVLDLPFHPEHARTLMLAQWRNGDYEGFFKWWRKLPLNNSPRTFEDYGRLFQLHAELGNPLMARECLITWVPMLAREDPPINLTQGHLTTDIMRCIELAEPRITEKYAEGNRSELTELWKACKAAKSASAANGLGTAKS